VLFRSARETSTLVGFSHLWKKTACLMVGTNFIDMSRLMFV
jgi:hypothetical protein